MGDAIGAALTQLLILFGAAVATGVARYLARRFPPPTRRRREDDDDQGDDDA